MKFQAILPLAAAALLAMAPGALASGLPPLDLEAGHGSAGVGWVLGGPVAAIDVGVGGDLSLGLLTQNSDLLQNGLSPYDLYGARATWAPWHNGWGVSLNGGYRAVSAQAPKGATGEARPGWYAMVGPDYEYGWGWGKLRAQLGVGWVQQRSLSYTLDGLITNQDSGGIGVWPSLELIFPVGEHVEIALGGAGLASVYARW